MRQLRDDRGALRLVTITRLLVILAIVGILGYDTFAVMSCHVSTENDAQNAAYAASEAWHNNNQNIELAYEAARAAITNPNETVLTSNFTVDPDGTVHLIVQRTAKTIVFGHLSFLHSWVVADEHGDANSVN